MTPEEVVDSLLDMEVLKKTKCSTCRMRKAPEINRAMIRFAGAKVSGETTLDWTDFHRLVLKKKYRYQVTVASMRRHMRDCLELS